MHEKQKAILDATLDLIAERGFHNTPMSLIAKRAGVSIGIIYHYYASKDDLIHALFRHVKAAFAKSLMVNDLQELPPPLAFRRIWLNAYEFYRSHPQETLFLEQYEHSPYYVHMSLAGTEHDELESEEIFAQLLNMYHRPDGDSLLKDLPLIALYTLSFGTAARMARQGIVQASSLDHEVLDSIAAACWQAIAR